MGLDHQIQTSRHTANDQKPHVHSLIINKLYISGAMSALPDNQSPSNRWHFTWGTTHLHSCSAVKNLYWNRTQLVLSLWLWRLSSVSITEDWALLVRRTFNFLSKSCVIQGGAVWNFFFWQCITPLVIPCWRLKRRHLQLGTVKLRCWCHWTHLLICI